MKNYLINKIMKSIEEKEDYSKQKLAEIKYGLESLYITITKTIVIFTLAYFLNILHELLLIILFYGLLRITAFGLHSKKSWQCWLSSLIVFILLPYVVKIITVSIPLRIILSITSIVFLAIFAPADTEKRPLINKRKRTIYKIITIITSIGITAYSFITTNILVQNAILISLILECSMISPLTYRIFKLKYANYKTYKKPITA